MEKVEKLIISAFVILLTCSAKLPEKKIGKMEVKSEANFILSVICNISNTGFDFKLGAFKLFKGNTLVETGTTDRFGTINVFLLRDCQYMLEMTAPGFYPKKVFFITNVSETVIKPAEFYFEVELINNNVLMGDEFCEMDNPYAMVYFNSETNEFDDDKDYSERINAIEEKIISGLMIFQ